MILPIRIKSTVLLVNGINVVKILRLCHFLHLVPKREHGLKDKAIMAISKQERHGEHDE